MKNSPASNKWHYIPSYKLFFLTVLFLKASDAMDDDNAALVANRWWSRTTAWPYVRGLVEDIDSLGMPRPAKKSASL